MAYDYNQLHCAWFAGCAQVVQESVQEYMVDIPFARSSDRCGRIDEWASPRFTVLFINSFYLVLSSEFRWDKDGVDILGAVSISTGESFIEFPLKGSNIKLMHRTTSTAV